MEIFFVAYAFDYTPMNPGGQKIYNEMVPVSVNLTALSKLAEIRETLINKHMFEDGFKELFRLSENTGANLKILIGKHLFITSLCRLA